MRFVTSSSYSQNKRGYDFIRIQRPQTRFADCYHWLCLIVWLGAILSTSHTANKSKGEHKKNKKRQANDKIQQPRSLYQVK